VDATISITDLTTAQLAERLASREPVPGGGSASAIAGAMAAGLVAMVAELTLGRPGADDAWITRIRDGARERMSRLLALAQQDAAAYDAVVRARRLPRETDGQRAKRAAAVRGATLEATRVPLIAAEVAVEVAELTAAIAPIGNPNAVSDAGVAAHLAGAAVHGALLNVRINLPYLPADEALRAIAPGDMTRLEEAAARHVRAALAAVTARMKAT
jgi:glutamate formiminotransferase/formiminotetrahydrofolate cyclodeaminase